MQIIHFMANVTLSSQNCIGQWDARCKSCSPFNWGEWNSMLWKIPNNHNNAMPKRHTHTKPFLFIEVTSHNAHEAIIIMAIKSFCLVIWREIAAHKNQFDTSRFYFSTFIIHNSQSQTIYFIWSVEAHICPLWNTEAHITITGNSICATVYLKHSRCVLSFKSFYKRKAHLMGFVHTEIGLLFMCRRACVTKMILVTCCVVV